VRKDLGVAAASVDHAALDYPDAKPNPRASGGCTSSRSAPKEYRLPTRAQLAEIHAVLKSRSELMTLLEWTGLRIEEAAALRWTTSAPTRRRAGAG